MANIVTTISKTATTVVAGAAAQTAAVAAKAALEAAGRLTDLNVNVACATREVLKAKLRKGVGVIGTIAGEALEAAVHNAQDSLGQLAHEASTMMGPEVVVDMIKEAPGQVFACAHGSTWMAAHTLNRESIRPALEQILAPVGEDGPVSKGAAHDSDSSGGSSGSGPSAAVLASQMQAQRKG